MLKKIVALATLAASLSFAAGGLVGETPVERPSKKLWWSSVAALAAATVFDARSSWGQHELNPLLQSPNGTFGARSVEIKSALVLAGVGFEWIALRHHHKAQAAFSYMNLAVTGATTGAAIHNLR